MSENLYCVLDRRPACDKINDFVAPMQLHPASPEKTRENKDQFFKEHSKVSITKPSHPGKGSPEKTEIKTAKELTTDSRSSTIKRPRRRVTKKKTRKISRLGLVSHNTRDTGSGSSCYSGKTEPPLTPSCFKLTTSSNGSPTHSTSSSKKASFASVTPVPLEGPSRVFPSTHQHTLMRTSKKSVIKTPVEFSSLRPSIEFLPTPHKRDGSSSSSSLDKESFNCTHQYYHSLFSNSPDNPEQGLINNLSPSLSILRPQASRKSVQGIHSITECYIPLQNDKLLINCPVINSNTIARHNNLIHQHSRSDIERTSILRGSSLSRLQRTVDDNQITNSGAQEGESQT